MARAKTPVTLVTGYLGSGKTTLVNALLEQSGRKVAVIVNEFGAVGVDGALIEGAAAGAGAGARVIELANGCLCCVVTGEFCSTLERIDASSFDHILIETSGAADPTSVLKLFWGAPELTGRYRLDAVVGVIDAARFLETRLRDPIASLQASVAEVQLLTKVDSAAPERVREVREALAGLNPSAELVEHDFSRGEKLPLERLLGIDAFRKPASRLKRLGADSRVSHGALTSVALSWEGTVAREPMREFFRGLVLDDKVVRTKALLHVEGEERAWLIQGVQSWIERTPAPKSYRGPNRLVILGRGLDPARLQEAIGRLRG